MITGDGDAFEAGGVIVGAGLGVAMCEGVGKIGVGPIPSESKLFSALGFKVDIGVV
jgi:hypothetical protein